MASLGFILTMVAMAAVVWWAIRKAVGVVMLCVLVYAMVCAYPYVRTLFV